MFVRQNDYVGALKLALSFYDRTARAVLGIISNFLSQIFTLECSVSHAVQIGNRSFSWRFLIIL